MNRGSLKLTNDEARVILENVTNDLTDVLLRQKLSATAENIQGEQEMVLSQDDVERLLDLIPPPTVNDSLFLSESRNKLRFFLSQLQK